MSPSKSEFCNVPMRGCLKNVSDSLAAMPNQRPVQHSREALQIAIKSRRVGRELYGTEPKRRYGSAAVRELVSDRVPRESSHCDI